MKGLVVIGLFGEKIKVVVVDVGDDGGCGEIIVEGVFEFAGFDDKEFAIS